MDVGVGDLVRADVRTRERVQEALEHRAAGALRVGTLRARVHHSCAHALRVSLRV